MIIFDPSAAPEIHGSMPGTGTETSTLRNGAAVTIYSDLLSNVVLSVRNGRATLCDFGAYLPARACDCPSEWRMAVNGGKEIQPAYFRAGEKGDASWRSAAMVEANAVIEVRRVSPRDSGHESSEVQAYRVAA